MDNFKKFQSQVQVRLFSGMMVGLILAAGLVLLINTLVKNLPVWAMAGSVTLIGVTVAWTVSKIMTNLTTKPLEAIWRAIIHVSAKHDSLGAPNIEDLGLGQELVGTLVPQIYQMASTANNQPEEDNDAVHNAVHTALETLPLPFVILSPQQTISYMNKAAQKYVSEEESKATGQEFNDIFSLSFPSEDTYETWLADCRGRAVTEAKKWERVRLLDKQGKVLHQCDLVAFFSKEASDKFETSLVLFDRSELYDRDDQEIGFMALAVHELRTPLTIMRGYIEVFQDELTPKLDPEQQDFMRRLNASAEQLTAFVSNILNVARVEENQLTLNLSEHKWSEVVHAAGHDMEMRAAVYGKYFEYNIHAGLPTVGVDRTTIYEVLVNLMDNAIKYSGESKRIIISARLSKEGMIETTVQDSGLGVPASVMPHLFGKFYRSHRSRDSIGGTGLGLYLSKAIVEAHGGHMWVRSKEGQGSTFGFTLQSYQNIASDQQNLDNNGEITRGAHGWIKNHSLYRR